MPTRTLSQRRGSTLDLKLAVDAVKSELDFTHQLIRAAQAREKKNKIGEIKARRGTLKRTVNARRRSERTENASPLRRKLRKHVAHVSNADDLAASLAGDEPLELDAEDAEEDHRLGPDSERAQAGAARREDERRLRAQIAVLELKQREEFLLSVRRELTAERMQRGGASSGAVLSIATAAPNARHGDEVNKVGAAHQRRRSGNQRRVRRGSIGGRRVSIDHAHIKSDGGRRGSIIYVASQAMKEHTNEHGVPTRPGRHRGSLDNPAFLKEMLKILVEEREAEEAEGRKAATRAVMKKAAVMDAKRLGGLARGRRLARRRSSNLSTSDTHTSFGCGKKELVCEENSVVMEKSEFGAISSTLGAIRTAANGGDGDGATMLVLAKKPSFSFWPTNVSTSAHEVKWREKERKQLAESSESTPRSATPMTPTASVREVQKEDAPQEHAPRKGKCRQGRRVTRGNEGEAAGGERRQGCASSERLPGRKKPPKLRISQRNSMSSPRSVSHRSNSLAPIPGGRPAADVVADQARRQKQVARMKASVCGRWIRAFEKGRKERKQLKVEDSGGYARVFLTRSTTRPSNCLGIREESKTMLLPSTAAKKALRLHVTASEGQREAISNVVANLLQASTMTETEEMPTHAKPMRRDSLDGKNLAFPLLSPTQKGPPEKAAQMLLNKHVRESEDEFTELFTFKKTYLKKRSVRRRRYSGVVKDVALDYYDMHGENPAALVDRSTGRRPSSLPLKINIRY